MSYITTKVRALKSYPTYQFYAAADSRSVEVGDVFRICVLEALRWIRSRLENHDLPQELDAPEPEDFRKFGSDRLCSFSFNSGFQIDVIYIEAQGVWSFRIAEPDMGANHGTPTERPAVNGRTFTTEIAFRRREKNVEVGIRTICSEPADTVADCEVFRPRLVKALVENELLRLTHCGTMIDKQPLELSSKTELDRFFEILNDGSRSLPVVLIAETGTEQKPVLQVEQLSVDAVPTTASFSLSGIRPQEKATKLTISADVQNFKMDLARDKKKKPRHKAEPKPVTQSFKLPALDHRRLAASLTGFALVVYVQEKFFKQIANKSGISLDHGDVLIIPRQQVTERHSYGSYRDDLEGFYQTLKATLIGMAKRAAYSFGEVLFYSDAKVREFHDKRKQTDSLEEKCELYRLEKAELNAQIKALSQQQTDMSQTAEALRLSQKKNEALSSEVEALKAECRRLKEETESKEAAYRRGAELIAFYRGQIEAAAHFPTDKKDICGWVESGYRDDVTVTSRAAAELRKYSGPLDIAGLCDGIVFLSAYAKYRRREITEDELLLFAERENWEVQGCGKEALKLHKTDYTITHNGAQHLLDMHIKRGIKAEELIRIYFCWDDESRRVLIGSMPGHLATVKNGT